MASERRTEAQDRAKAATGSACYSGKVYKNVPDEVLQMNRSGNAGFNRLVFFGNRGDGLFLLEGRGCGGEGILLSFIAQSALV